MKTTRRLIITACTVWTVFPCSVCLRAPAAQFADVTVAAGVTNVPGYCLSAAWGDYNNDNRIDLYLAIGGDVSGTNALFRNNGNGTFTRVGAEGGPIATDVHDSQGCAWVDFNNDGYRDMFVVNGGWALSRNDLYWNNGNGTFRSGIAGDLTRLSLIRGWSAAADYDGDGLVEIFVPEGTALWGPLTNRLYHTTAFGSFFSTDLAPAEGYANSGVWGDYDGDGDPDLFVCGYTSPSRLYRNDGGGHFTAVSNGLPTGGTTAHAAWADYDNDGDLDIALCSFSGAAVYRNDGTNGFALAITLPGARAWGAWADYDNDGHLDFLSVCGQDSPYKAALYHNNGDGTFSTVADVFTEAPDYWLASPWGDFDNDGFMDVILTHQYGQHRLYRNLGNTNHWIKFRLAGMASNRDAIGAKVRVQATIAGQSVWQMQEVNGGYAMQNDTRLNFGLGDATIVDKVCIEWPSGNVQEYSSVTANQIVTSTEPVYITPTRPVASIGGSVTLTAQRPGTRQWYHEGVLLEGQTNTILSITNIQFADGGRYSVVTSSGSTFYTNYVYLLVSPAQFEDVTVKAGVTNAPGYCISAAWGDYNNDQFVDLYLAIGAEASTVNALFRNNRNGTFTRVGSEAGPIATDVHDSAGCAWIDFNNDGYRDMFVLNSWDNPSRNDLYWNNGDGTFGRGNAGNLTQLSQVHSWSASADYDGDGWVDIFVAEGASGTSPFAVRLYHATGMGTFTSTNLGPTLAYANDGVWGDYDNDGDPDLFVCAYTSPSTLWRNDGRGNFTPANNGLPSNAETLHAAWADYDRDGDLDIALSSFSDTRIYRNDGTNGFVLGATLDAVTAAAWADYDNDGYLDLLVAGGQNTARKPGLFHNNGDGSFSRVVDIFTEVADNSLACPWGDIDNDGFMDVVLTHQYGQHRLYRNLGNTNHWVKFKLVGTASNKDAIGAKVRVQATIGGQSVWQMQEVNGGDQFQNDTRLNFGLGDATVVAKVRIEWPSGNVQEYSSVSPNRIVTCTEQVLITPVRPTVSIGGSVTFTSQLSGLWQWYHEGAALEDQTNRTLNLSRIQVADAGRYSVVTSLGGTFYTNFVSLFVDTQFTKINEGPVVTDTGNCPAIASGDFDRDGFADLFVTRYQLGTSAVYRNNRDGTFTRALDLPFGQQSNEIGVWGDLDNDGSVDLLHELIGSIGGDCDSSSVYFNDGDATFTASQRAPLPAYGNRSLVDYNNDGFLDVYYSRFAQNRLYRNNGDRTFTLMTAGDVGNIANMTTFGGTCWADFNDDGWPDLYAPDHQGNQSLMFRNDGTGRFVAVTNLVTQTVAPAISGAWGDYDNDGKLDLAVAAHSGTSVVYRNLGNGEFERPAGTPTLTGSYNFAAWVDYDNDGFLDLFFSGYTSGNKLFRNNGDGTFTAVTTGSIVGELPPLGAGSYAGLWFDYDNDGFLDLYVINGDDASSIPTANQLYHNNGNSNAWLRVKLLGTVSNRDGIGAKVRVQASYAGGMRSQRRDIIGGDEENGNRLSADFGLGNATIVYKLRIEWPSGVVEEFMYMRPRQIVTVVEPSLKGSLGPDGRMHLAMTMSTNRVYQLQASADFVNWTVLTNCTGSGSRAPIEYLDPQAPASGAARFYRMK